MKNILILGAKGNLGQQLVEAFADLHVTAWDREKIDLGKRNELEEKISVLRPEIVLNAAAYNDVDRAEEEPELARRVNGEAVGWLAEICHKIGAVFVHYSTDYVFKGDKKEGYLEDDRPEPQSEYGKSKFLGEQKILNLSKRYPGFQFYLIRTSRLFGPAGESVNSKASFMETVLRLAREKRRLEMVDSELSSPTYTPDLALVTRRLIASKEGGIYHLTNYGACTWYGWAKKILELAKIKKPLYAVPASQFFRPAARPAYSVLLNTKFPLLRSWQEALEAYLLSSRDG